VSGTDPDDKDRPIDATRAWRPADRVPEPAQPNLPRIPGITLQREIARGGMGVVYSGRQDFLDRRVAVKLLSVELGNESFAQRFQREAKILAGIKHPNIVACHMAGTTDEGQSYLVMEFIDGPTLKNWVLENGPLTVPAALRLTRAVGQALAHAHTLGIIHRDVKPENILLETLTSTAIDVAFPFTPKIVDLGLARASEGTASLGLTSPGSVMGTPATMSPEQFDEPEAVDFRSDIYGLGCALYEMLTGKPAFRGKKLTDIVTQKRAPVAPNPCFETDVPAAVGAFVQCMLASNRDDRPRSYKAGRVARCARQGEARGADRRRGDRMGDRPDGDSPVVAAAAGADETTGRSEVDAAARQQAAGGSATTVTAARAGQQGWGTRLPRHRRDQLPRRGARRAVGPRHGARRAGVPGSGRDRGDSPATDRAADEHGARSRPGFESAAARSRRGHRGVGAGRRRRGGVPGHERQGRERQAGGARAGPGGGGACEARAET
jgi:tRNA A-37 threonylcarbamoyl transferase component Bud32